MKLIKTLIIHMLGGLTIEESVESDGNCFDLGFYRAFVEIKKHADSLYGVPAEEWCKEMYEYIKKGNELQKPKDQD